MYLLFCKCQESQCLSGSVKVFVCKNEYPRSPRRQTAAKKSMDEVFENLNDLFCEKDGLKVFLEDLLRHAMDHEVEDHLGAGYHERSSDRRGQRNGFKPRPLGPAEDPHR